MLNCFVFRIAIDWANRAPCIEIEFISNKANAAHESYKLETLSLLNSEEYFSDFTESKNFFREVPDIPRIFLSSFLIFKELAIIVLDPVKYFPQCPLNPEEFLRKVL